MEYGGRGVVENAGVGWRRLLVSSRVVEGEWGEGLGGGIGKGRVRRRTVG
jgi:hypothetical protein